MTPLTLIGIDCAVDPRRVGLCRARSEDGRTEVVEVRTGGPDLEEILAAWVQGAELALLALDAPLGWPDPMRELLPDHRAGEPLDIKSNRMFRRETDRVVRAETGKLPLDVGSNLIARTAHSALGRLSRLREATGQDLPLCWDRPPTRSSVIEVYPAATRRAHGLASPRSFNDRRTWCSAILEEVRKRIALPDSNPIADDPHQCDGVLCVLAAHDFLHGEVLDPADRELAQREGWIWVRKP